MPDRTRRGPFTRMTPGRHDLQLYSGADIAVALLVRTAAGDPVDVTGREYAAQVRDRRAGILLGEFDVEVADPTNGVVVLRLTGTQVSDISGGVWDVVERIGNTARPLLTGRVRRTLAVTPPTAAGTIAGGPGSEPAAGYDPIVIEAISTAEGSTVTGADAAATIVEVGIVGPRGLDGEDGTDGSAGSYTHTQVVASTMWVIDHGLGYPPAVTCLDADGFEIDGAVSHPTTNRTIVEFNVAVAGAAFLS